MAPPGPVSVSEGSTPAIDVSVVLPARDAAATIGHQLDALVSQTFDGTWEVIVVDDGSQDTTAQIAAQWTDRFPSLTILSLAAPTGSSNARNAGAGVARGRLFAYCDADDVVSSRWLSGIVSALSDNALATGPIDLALLNARRLYAWRRGSGWQQLPRWMGYLTPIMTCNMGVQRDAFESVGGFDEALRTGADFDFAWRVQLAGRTVGYASDALVHWRLRKGWAFFLRSVEYGAAHVLLYRRFRDLGLRRQTLRGGVRLVCVVVGIPLLAIPFYRYAWITLAGVEFGRIKGSFIARTVYL